MIGGKRRVARDNGKYTGGALPLGYDVDTDGRLVLSQREVYPGCTEAELALSIFQRIAAGSSTNAEVKRLNALGVKPARRFSGGKVRESKSGAWYDTKIAYLIRNTVYKGSYPLKSRHGTVDRSAPALVSAELWQQANEQIVKNRAVLNGNQQWYYTLSGLMVCAHCGLHYAGTRIKADAYYRCGGHRLQKRCQSKHLNAEWVEMHVFSAVADWWRKAKAEPFAQIEIVDHTADITQLQHQLLVKETERQRIIDAWRKGRILTIEDVERQMKAIDAEKLAIESQLQQLESQDAIYAVVQEKYDRIRQIGMIELEGDKAEQRRLTGMAVSKVTVTTEGTGHKKNAIVSVRFLTGEEKVFKRQWWHTSLFEVEHVGA
jgi:site-specific DNA recombinase